MRTSIASSGNCSIVPLACASAARDISNAESAGKIEKLFIDNMDMEAKVFETIIEGSGVALRKTGLFFKGQTGYARWMTKFAEICITRRPVGTAL